MQLKSKIKQVLLLITPFLFFSLIQSGKDEMVISNFISELTKEENVDLLVTGKTFMRIDSVTQEKVIEKDSVVRILLKGLKSSINRSGGLGKLSILSLEKTRDIAPLKGLVTPNPLNFGNAYVVLDSDQQLVFPVLVKNGKIISVSTFSKGKKRYFLIL